MSRELLVATHFKKRVVVWKANSQGALVDAHHLSEVDAQLCAPLLHQVKSIHQVHLDGLLVVLCPKVK